ncbi:MAG: hypothetical protein HOY71_44110 [Nonomuraea sp.]|nr:hypothetical protein [Nonomuraea sp.]
MVVPPARGRDRAPSGGRLGFAAGAESADRELSELGRSVDSLASLLLVVPVGMLIDRLRSRTLLSAMSLVASSRTRRSRACRASSCTASS